MLYWMKGSEAETLRGLGELSKAEILREIVTDKLATAAREIFAVVERTLAGYEHEAAGLRRQLELLQPRVHLGRTAAIPDDLLVVTEEEGAEPVKRRTGVTEVTEDTSLIWLQDDDSDESEQPAHQSCKQSGEDRKDPDYQAPSRTPSQKRRPGRPRVSDTQTHLDLRIRILDSQANVLSRKVFQKCPVQELQCPRGLQEADFLHLLRATFPQLTADRPFDVFTTDRTKRLKPLTLAALTPEEIDRSLRAVGHSALYIRLQDDGESSSGVRSADPSQRGQGSSSPRGGCDRRGRGRPRLGREPTHHSLRVCMLEGTSAASPPETSASGLHTGPVHQLKCPGVLGEDDFLDLLKSVFPPLAEHNSSVSALWLDGGRRLRRLQVSALTPQEIHRALKSSGATVLYIRPKSENEDGKEEELHLLAGTNGATSPCPGSSSGHLQAAAAAAAGDREVIDAAEEQTQARRSDEEPSERSKTLCKVCGACYRLTGALIKHSWEHADEQPRVCGVCGDPFESADELKRHLRTYQTTHTCSICGKSFFSAKGLQLHVTLHTGNRPFHCDVCSKTFARISGLSAHRWVHVADKAHKCDVCSKAFGLKAQLRAHVKRHAGRDKFQCNVCGKSMYDMRSLTRHRVTHSGERRHVCGVCGKRFKLAGTLKSHEKTHTARERPYLCDICCKTFMCNSTLMAHMRTHSGERPFACATCSKHFVSNGELKAHMRVHSNEAPYGCSQCGRSFKRKAHLSSHIRTHLGIKLFVCSVCGKACSRQEHLMVHMRTHSGERPYKCSLCDKAFTQGHCLKTHMKVHAPDAAAAAPDTCTEAQ